MLKPKKDQIQARTVPNFSDDSVKINAGSLVFENTWITYNSSIYRINDYITSVVQGSRTRFFKNRNNAIFLLIGIDIDEGIKTIEGKSVLFTTVDAVPPPDTYDIIPLVGVVLIQDGTDDLNFGYKPLHQAHIKFFSGAGNVIDRNQKGSDGPDSDVPGYTGLMGETGIPGLPPLQGETGPVGFTGITPEGPQGETGLQGMTGIYWDIHIPYEEIFF